jgi:hypothetical protein
MQDIAAVAAELTARARAASDARGYFAAMYARVTRQVAARIEDGGFEDPARMERFAVRFARYYLDALPPGTGPRPRCWQATLDVTADDSLLIVQHLLLGINAHVNHDLALTVVDIADDAGALAPIRTDFDAINAILAATQQGVLRDLHTVARWVNTAACVGGGQIFNFSLEVARDQAWSAAERMYPLGAAERAAHRAELDRLVSVLAYLITQPKLWARPALWLARSLERRDHGEVVAALLGSS